MQGTRLKDLPLAGPTLKLTCNVPQSNLDHFQCFPQETWISAFNLCRDFLRVRHHSPDVIVCLAFLSWDITPHVPAVRLRKQCDRTHFIDMFLECQCSVGCRHKLGDMILVQVCNRLDDPCALKLQTGRSVAKRRRSMWTVCKEQIRKVINRHAETVRISIQMGGPDVGNGYYLGTY